MHILIIHQAFAGLDEAGGTRHYELAQYLYDQGHKITIIASPVSYLSGKTANKNSKFIDTQIINDGIKILRVYTYPALHKSFVHRVFSFFSFMMSSLIAGIGIKNVDVVWGTSPPIFQGASAWLLSKLKKAKFLFEVRDLWPAFAIAVGVLKNHFLINASLWLERFLYTHADQIMVNSPGYINHVMQKGAKNVELIPNGADPDMFTSDAGSISIREQYNLTDKFIVLYAGAHGMSNDLEVILEAADITRKDERVQYVFVGDGKEKQNLIEFAESKNLSNVLFLPPFPKIDMPAVINEADICVAILKPIELYKTTYPNKVFDYMVSSRPVLLAIDGVIREVVEKADAGKFVEPGNPKAMANMIISLANDDKSLITMGKNGQLFIKKYYNRKIIARKLNTLLEKLEGTK